MKEFNVLHLVRKSSQLKSSFIYNQITNHIQYTPYVIFRKKINKQFDGGFVVDKINNDIIVDLTIQESIYEKLLYKFAKRLSYRQIKTIKNFIRNNKIDICHFHFGSDCGVYMPLLKNIQIPSIVSFYGYDCTSFPNRYFGFGKIFLNKRVFNKATKILAMSSDMKNDLVNIGCPEEKIIIHYHGIDTLRFYQPNRRYLNSECITILNLCSLVPKKGQLFLLKSIEKMIQNKVFNFKLIFIGTGKLDQILKKYTLQHNLTPYVQFVGAIPYGGIEMHRAYEIADIFVHPSVNAPNGDKEGIPGTIIEAMSAGIPVITTYHAGIPSIIKNNETGILVNEHDHDSLTQVMITLINNPKMRKKIGKAGQNYVINKLNIVRKEIELEEIYNQII